MERILELARKKAQKAEVFRIEKQASPVMFYGGKLSALEGETSQATGLRVIVEGKLGFSSTTHPTETDGLVDRAIESARFGPPVMIEFPDFVRDFGQSTCFDPKVANLTLKDLVSTGQTMVDIVKKDFPDVNLEVEVTREIHRVSIMNTNGGNVSYHKTIHQAFLNVLMMLPSDRAELEDTTTSTHFSDAPAKMAETAVWRFKNCLRVAPVETKKMTVVFTSLGFRGLYVPLIYGLNGDLVFRKLSRLTGKLESDVIDSRITILDDPLQNGLPASCPFDDEGVPAYKKIFFEKGVLKGFFYDLQTAFKAGVKPTGNGFKKSSLYTGFSVDAQPNPTPSNLIILPGTVSRDDLIAHIDEGIIVDDTMGAGQGNNLNGEFSMNVALGYKIEKGKIVGRVKDVMVAGNVFDIMKNNLRGLTTESYAEDTLFGRYKVPWIAFDNMPVSSK